MPLGNFSTAVGLLLSLSSYLFQKMSVSPPQVSDPSSVLRGYYREVDPTLLLVKY